MVFALAPTPPTSAADPVVEHPRNASTEREAVLARGMTEARDLYRHTDVAPKLVDRLAEDAVDALWVKPLRVTSYLPILALRIVRDMARSGGSAISRDRHEPA